MRQALRIILAGLGCVAIASIMVAWLTGRGGGGERRRAADAPKARAATASRIGGLPLKVVAARAAAAAASRATFPDPNAPGTSSRVYVDRSEIDQGVFQACIALAPARDDRTLGELTESLR